MAKFRNRLGMVMFGAVIAVTRAGAQTPPAQVNSAESEARLKLQPRTWMVGEWTGPATVTNSGQSFTLTQHEKVVLAAKGTVLLIQGQGTINGTIGFEAAGLLSYDMGSRQFKWVSSGGSGYLGISEAEVKGGTLVWFLPGAGGSRTRYTIWKSPKGEWQEIGETSQDNRSWTRTFAMTLVTK